MSAFIKSVRLLVKALTKLGSVNLSANRILECPLIKEFTVNSLVHIEIYNTII